MEVSVFALQKFLISFRMDVDVTGISSLEDTLTDSFSKCRSINPNFATVSGSPFEIYSDKEHNDAVCSDESSCSSDEDFDIFSR